MKTLALAATILLIGLSASPVRGQGTVYLSNSEYPSIDSVTLGQDSWFASGLWHTGNNPEGYALNSVDLVMLPATGNPSGFSIHIYDYNSVTSLPGVSIGALTGPDPVSGGVFTYDASDIFLSPSTSYFVVLAATTPVADGAYQWSLSGSAEYTSIDGWLYGVGNYRSDAGLAWGYSRIGRLQMAITATPIPEPASGTLLIVGGLALAAFHLRTHSRRI